MVVFCFCFKKMKLLNVVVTHAFSHSMWEAEAAASLWIQASSWLGSKATQRNHVSKENKQKARQKNKTQTEKLPEDTSVQLSSSRP